MSETDRKINRRHQKRIHHSSEKSAHFPKALLMCKSIHSFKGAEEKDRFNDARGIFLENYQQQQNLRLY